MMIMMIMMMVMLMVMRRVLNQRPGSLRASTGLYGPCLHPGTTTTKLSLSSSSTRALRDLYLLYPGSYGACGPEPG